VCDSTDYGHGSEASAALMPRAVEGDAVDPIALEPVDELTVTTLVDNSYDGLMGDMGAARRAPMARTKRVPAQQFLEGETVGGLVAEHGSRRW
jgi:7,8-dihydropterin-6-yl-methyl-4-(beta-D-ribofuranosyl)aminobenzene 5'-phosphate synthase